MNEPAFRIWKTQKLPRRPSNEWIWSNVCRWLDHLISIDLHIQFGAELAGRQRNTTNWLNEWCDGRWNDRVVLEIGLEAGEIHVSKAIGECFPVERQRVLVGGRVRYFTNAISHDDMAVMCSNQMSIDVEWCIWMENRTYYACHWKSTIFALLFLSALTTLLRIRVDNAY